MPASIVTLEDMDVFKAELLKEIEDLLISYDKITIDKWIKSNVVMTKLGISPGTLQNFRINGTLPFSKLGGIIYYDEERINEILIDNCTNDKS
ncbi:MAG: helix-turn-helix domain-containing protein [Flavobacteriaceae bacterium]|nr:helix-turn-helix domain-containing protein [Flavobacteriaceae bacterium]